MVGRVIATFLLDGDVFLTSSQLSYLSNEKCNMAGEEMSAPSNPEPKRTGSMLH